MRKANAVSLYRRPSLLPALVSVLLLLTARALAQDTVTGAFDGVVIDKVSKSPVKGATVELINREAGKLPSLTTDPRGQFFRPLLRPGTYTVRVTKAGYQDLEVTLDLPTLRRTEFESTPDGLEPAAGGGRRRSPSSSPGRAKVIVIALTPRGESSRDASHARPQAAGAGRTVDRSFGADLFRTDARRDGAFTPEELAALPLGGTTLVRTFDELALLLPGVAPPPQTVGNGSGPGVGAGVGSAGQFAVNGLRSRGNNFTVDGSDNNDEDIGMRRQGFLELIPQPVESVQEYQVITLLAPAQFGHSMGAQVNAVSRSGGSEYHGVLYGLFNSSQLNARNPFDTTNGEAVSPLFSGNQPVVTASGVVSSTPTNIIGTNNSINRRIFSPDATRRQMTVRNESGGEDSLTLGQGGFAAGGPLRRARAGRGLSTFFFASAEAHVLNATEEHSFAVPTVAQRGIFGTGASSNVNLTPNPLLSPNQLPNALNRYTFPASQRGNAVFSFFPFPNNTQGVYGPNTFTRQLHADAHGGVFSVKLDTDFRAGGRPASFAARYNFTNDFRTLPVTGDALFSSMQARVRTQNLSLFLNNQLTRGGSAKPVFNQLRLSYGRTRLVFDEVPDREFLLPSSFFDRTFGSFGLLNAPLLENLTSAQVSNGRFVANTGDVFYLTSSSCGTPARRCTTEDRLGPVGQVIVAGFSPVGIDVFNFPQRRVNNTYQFADHLTARRGDHTFAFGTDDRRVELNSDLPRNARALLTFNGSLPLPLRPATTQGLFSLPPDLVVRPEDLAAAGAASGDFLTLGNPGSSYIHLRLYQCNFFAQDEWRARPNLSLSYGLRYEYNTPPREVNNLIESTFDSDELDVVPGLRTFLDGRSRIYDPDRNNFAPRVGVAYSKNFFGRRVGETIVRAGYGLYFDQILGAVVSQSRNVFPSFITMNLAGGNGNRNFNNPDATTLLSIIDPHGPVFGQGGIVEQGTINQPNALVSLATLSAFVNQVAGSDILSGVSGFGATLAARHLEMPVAHQYAVTVEQRLGARVLISAGYVGTRGRRLLRFTTPNLGPNAIVEPLSLTIEQNGSNPNPAFFGVALPPGARFNAAGVTGGRPVQDVGVINLFETSAASRYDALQLQARGRLRDSISFQTSYTLSKATDDVSDVFDLAGSPALPQNSLTFEGEYAPANFDVRHRFTYDVVYDLPDFKTRAPLARAVFGGLRLAATGRFRTGQPFTANSIFDVNLDGNLTDRLDSTKGLVATGDRRQPLMLTTADTFSLLAPVGQSGRVRRNAFRAGNVLELDLAVDKRIDFGERRSLLLRVEAFNFINRANYGVPVRFLEARAFGQATGTITPGRRVQIVLRYSF